MATPIERVRSAVRMSQCHSFLVTEYYYVLRNLLRSTVAQGQGHKDKDRGRGPGKPTRWDGTPDASSICLLTSVLALWRWEHASIANEMNRPPSMAPANRRARNLALSPS